MTRPEKARKLANHLNAGFLCEYESKRDASRAYKRRLDERKFDRIVSFVLAQTCTIRRINETAFK